MQPATVIWLSTSMQAQCIRECDRTFPNETGGAFMGYWHNEETAVVTAIIGPGPNAIHEQYNFEPDYQWQIERIAEHYQNSGRYETYIGDWHNHPLASSGRLSRLDRQVLRRIIATPDARADTPLMAIFYGDEDTWDLAVWVAHVVPRPLLWSKLIVDEVSVQLF